MKEKGLHKENYCTLWEKLNQDEIHQLLLENINMVTRRESIVLLEKLSLVTRRKSMDLREKINLVTRRKSIVLLSGGLKLDTNCRH